MVEILPCVSGALKQFCVIYFIEKGGVVEIVWTSLKETVNLIYLIQKIENTGLKQDTIFILNI